MGHPKNWFGGITLLMLLITLSIPAFIVDDAFGNVRLAFDSTSLDFGNVALSNARELALEVWDTAAVPIEIDQVSLAGLEPGDFSIVSPTQYPIVLSPGTSPTEIIVQFSPQTFGSRSAQLLIETSDGNVTIPLSGFCSGGADLAWAVPNIDFGAIAPGGELDTVIELYSTGTDPAIVDGIQVGASDTSFAAQFANGIVPPINLAPGDSIAVDIAFRGLSSTGTKEALLTAIGNLLNNPSCDLFGNDILGDFTTLPSPTIDFGILYAGQVLDSTIQLINSGDVNLVFEDLELSPPGEDFTLLNAPQTPFTLAAGDTLSLTIRANPGIATAHRAQLQLVSEEADTIYKADTLTVSVIPPPITAPLVQSLSYHCAIVSPVADTIPISNFGTQRVVITVIASSDTSIALLSDVSFPDTISAGITQPVIIHFIPISTVANTLVIAMMGGKQIMLTDTLVLQPLPTQANASITAIVAPGMADEQLEVSAANALTAFDLDSIIVHIVVLDTNVATIDPSSISLAPGIANAAVSSIQQEADGYGVVITSASPIIIPAGSPIVEMNLNRYVSNTSLTNVIASIETPELTGCLNWTGDTVIVSGPAICGSAELQNFLSDTLHLSATLRENPISGQNADLSITTSQISDTRYELINALGEILFEGYVHLVPALNNCLLSLPPIPAGIYTIHLTPETGLTLNLRLVKID